MSDNDKEQLMLEQQAIDKKVAKLMIVIESGENMIETITADVNATKLEVKVLKSRRANMMNLSKGLMEDNTLIFEK